jgi:hypothetical protein
MKIRFTLTVAALFILLITCPLLARAQANRTFVIGNAGTDTGICPRTAPAKRLTTPTQ